MTDKDKSAGPQTTEESQDLRYRQKKVAALKAAVEAGTYQVDPEAVATSIMRDLAAEELQRRRQARASNGEADFPEGLEVGQPDQAEPGSEEKP